MAQEEPNDSFFTKLEKRVMNANSLLCVGLDPHKAQVRSKLLKLCSELMNKCQLTLPELDCAVQFCINIIEKTHSVAAAYKPNSAFFEAFGGAGVEALKNVISAIPSDIPVILDCKRGDIDTTAMVSYGLCEVGVLHKSIVQAYADASFNYLNADCVTLSPYMGWDSIAPFVTKQFAHKGAFLLCKTSNKSSSELQDLTLTNGNKVFEQVQGFVQLLRCNNDKDRWYLCLLIGMLAAHIPQWV